jgi:hypothetical protein
MNAKMGGADYSWSGRKRPGASLLNLVARLQTQCRLITLSADPMTTVLRVLAIVCLGGLTFFTSSKLLRMAKIRGFVSGPPPLEKIISAKAVVSGEYNDAYWLAWDSADIRVPGRNRINVPEELWDRSSVGDRISVIYFADSKWPYTRDGIYASDENFVFDGILLLLWLIGIGVAAYFQLRHVRRMRPPPLPKND